MFSNYAIQEIRLLPLSKEKEFPTWNDVTDYLDHDLPVKYNWKFWYREKGIDLENTDALILFQYDAQIVGHGVFKTRVAIEQPPEMVRGELVIYHGYNEFYPNSVRRIHPITSQELTVIAPDFRRFSRMKKIDLKYLAQICQLLKQKEIVP